MMTDYFHRLRTFYAASLQKTYGDPIGASSQDIDALEQRLRYSLPLAYRQFLLWMGKDTNGIYRGTDCFLHHIEANNHALPELLHENKVMFPLAQDYVAFFMHQGYIVAWFDLPAQADDPVVWLYTETTGQPPQMVGTLTEFIEHDLRSLAQEATT